jgi:hypothetical protein
LSVLALLLAGLCFSFSAAGQEKKKEEKKKPKPPPANVYTDVDTAPIDYKIQGEYTDKTLAAQVVALGNSKFDVYILQGGLPGAGWDVKSKKIKIEAKLDADKGVATFKGKEYSGTIDAGKKSLTLETDKAPQASILQRVERKSPALGAKPPEGALILFDGKNVDEWNEKKMVGDLLGVPNTTKKKFKNFKLHIEFRTPFQPTARGQGRGNSGVYVCGREVQVLDSFGLAGLNNECGGIYSFRAPDVNMCLPPLVWQTYDIEHRPGKVDPETKKQGGPRITVVHNGVTIHDNVELKGGASEGPIHLQNHGNPLVYRNVWLVELKN